MFNSLKRMLVFICIVIVFFIILKPLISLSSQAALKEVESDLSKEQCYLCGNNEYSLAPYYKKFKSMGLWNLGTMDICDTRVRTFTEDGLTETGENGGTMYNHFEDGSSIVITSMPDRGIAEAQIMYGENNQVNLRAIAKCLCRECLQKIRDIFRDSEESSSNCGNIVLLNFETLEIYGLPEKMRGFMVHDYYVHIDHNREKQEVSLYIFYSPRKKFS